MSTLANPRTEEDLRTTSSIQECSALVDRIAASSQFRRSARLRDFLIYVGRESLKDGGAEMHEQDIGAHVFGRPVNYDRTQDNIVRVNATELRKRIDQYFITEGADEPLIMEIPRGGYRAVFRRRSTRLAVPLPRAEAPVPEPAAVPATTPAELRIPQLFWVACIVILAALCIYLFVQNRSLRTSAPLAIHNPTVEAFWQTFQQNNPTTDIVLPDDSLSLIEDLINRPVPLEDYLSRDFMRQVAASDLSADRKYDASQIFAHNLITFGGVRAAEEMMPYLSGANSTHLTLSRYYEGDAIKQHNVILVGGKKANPWVHLFDDQINFVTDFDHVRGQALVYNRQPKPGEQPDYRVSSAPNALIGYSSIAFLPNPSHTGNAVILAGTDSDATSAAAEFLTSEDQLRKFEKALHVQKLPYFEVLLKTSRLSGTSLSAEVLAYRTYPELH
jgi:hypothetical protein